MINEYMKHLNNVKTESHMKNVQNCPQKNLVKFPSLGQKVGVVSNS